MAGENDYSMHVDTVAVTAVVDDDYDENNYDLEMDKDIVLQEALDSNNNNKNDILVTSENKNEQYENEYENENENNNNNVTNGVKNISLAKQNINMALDTLGRTTTAIIGVTTIHVDNIKMKEILEKYQDNNIEILKQYELYYVEILKQYGLYLDEDDLQYTTYRSQECVGIWTYALRDVIQSTTSILVLVRDTIESWEFIDNTDMFYHMFSLS